jgi:hypothetical protein
MSAPKSTKYNRQLRYQQRHRAQGLCTICSNKADAPYLMCAQHRYKGRPQPFKAPETRAAALTLWLNGYGCAQLAMMFHCTDSAVRMLIKRLTGAQKKKRPQARPALR